MGRDFAPYHRAVTRPLSAHYGSAALGLAVALFVLAPGRAITPDELPSCPAVAAPAAEPAAQYVAAAVETRYWEPDDPRRHAIVAYVSQRFTIAADAAERLVGASHYAAARVGLDPLLVLAVIAVESRFNPIAESVAGAKGLMQIIPKYHQDKLREYGGDEQVLEPVTNILVGARILDEYIRNAGSTVNGLQFYNGALWDSSGQYARKVLAERERIADAVRGVETLRLADAGS